MPDEPRYELNKKSDDLIYVKYPSVVAVLMESLNIKDS